MFYKDKSILCNYYESNVLGLSEGLLGAVGIQTQELLLCVRVRIAPFGTRSQVEAKLK